jgi:hypothetical protein
MKIGRYRVSIQKIQGIEKCGVNRNQNIKGGEKSATVYG